MWMVAPSTFTASTTRKSIVQGPGFEPIGTYPQRLTGFGAVVEPDPDLRMRGQLRLSEGLHDLTDVADDAMPRDDRRSVQRDPALGGLEGFRRHLLHA